MLHMIYNKITEMSTPQGEGSWASSLCVNATTNIFHNEMDCTYTLISVPLQKKSMMSYQFLFWLNDANILGIKLNPNVAMFFSGLLVTHRQDKFVNTRNGNNNDIFMNVSSYGNQRLFCHIKKSFQRTTGNN